MADADLAALVTGGREDLDVEYKSWVDTSQNEVKANLARHIAALSNHGGGYLIFGVEERSRKPQGATPLDRSLFGEDAVSSIVTRYLEPAFQCQTIWTASDGVDYPTVVVPAHGPRPVVAKADGPHDDRGRPIGLRQGQIYIRAPGPQSVAIRTPEAWTALLERCLSHRADLLASIMQRAIGRPSKPSPHVAEMLKAGCDATAADFISQIAATKVPPEEEAWFRAAARNFSVNGYALVGDDGDLLEIEDPHTLNERVGAGLRLHYGKSAMPFRHVRMSERAPQMRTGSLGGREVAYLEGMRLPNMAVLGGRDDYWRIYRQGVVAIAENYREDHIVFRTESGSRFLLIQECLAKLHGLLVHARLVGQEMPSVSQFLFRMHWRGLRDRTLGSDPDSVLMGGKKMVDELFVNMVTLPWSELRNSYFDALRRVVLPLIGLFNFSGPTAAELLTPDFVNAELRKIDPQMHLLDL